jgi:predicted XRE-type DNA-binding protein
VDNLTANVDAPEWGDPADSFRVRIDPTALLTVLRQRDSDENSLRSQLAAYLNTVIRERRLTQTAVSGIFGIPQSHISELRNHKLSRFSSERLLRFVTLLDRNVDIVIRPKEKDHSVGTISVQVAL